MTRWSPGRECSKLCVRRSGGETADGSKSQARAQPTPASASRGYGAYALSPATLQYAVTVSVAVALLVRWKVTRASTHHHSRWWSAPAAGVAAGALTTSTNASGPPLLLHLTGRGTEPARVRDTINVCYLGLSAVSAAALWLTHTTGALPDPAVLAALIPLVVLGNLAGRPLFTRLARGGAYESVLTATLALAVLTGLATTIL